MVEQGGELARQVSCLTFPAGGDAERVVGITGAPGAGKSTLVDRVITLARRAGDRVGVLAVDPTSPFSGGAILGDRVRMQGHTLDEGVFIRSMATRGHLGGLTLAVPGAIRVLAAVGMKTVIVETVGVGQVEVEIAAHADTTVVVVNPGWGDSVQAAKAGLLEVADIFVVNKSDRPGAAEARLDLEHMLDMDPSMGEWRPPVLLSTATSGEGADELWSAIERHGEHLRTSGELGRRRERHMLEELEEVLVRRLEADVRSLAASRLWRDVSGQLLHRQIDPYVAADRLVAGTARL
jgi:LAO/AO transport system kinase